MEGNAKVPLQSSFFQTEREIGMACRRRDVAILPQTGAISQDGVFGQEIGDSFAKYSMNAITESGESGEEEPPWN